MTAKTAARRIKREGTLRAEGGKSGGSRPSRRRWPLWILLGIAMFFAGVRFHLRNLPLERDEGEYAYAGQLIVDGIPPYQFAYMKLPGTYAAYALIMAIFGQTSGGIHIGLLLGAVACFV